MDQTISKPKITRRDVLKVSTVMAAAVAASETFIGKQKPRFVPQANAAQAAQEDGWYPGVCKMCMQGDCQQRVHVVDGVVVQLEGETRARQNEGALCPRGNSSIMQMYNPWRVKAPMKRTNPKKALTEDPQFVEITWDEAYNTITEKLQAIRQDNPKKLVVCSGFGVRNLTLSWFERVFGTPNDIASRGSACAYHLGSYLVNGNGPDNVPDIEKCDYILNIARTLGPNIATASVGTRHMLDALERGIKIVNVDPRCSPEVSKSTEWVPIRPGTEQAFLLGMLWSMMNEIGLEKLDLWSIKNRTNGPYLIGPDGEYVLDPESNKPLIWDEVESRARTFDDIPPMQSALEGTYEVNGVSCTPAYQIVRDGLSSYTPEWAAGISTVPAATIRRLAEEFVDHAKIGSTVEIDGFTFPFRPVSIQFEKGAYQHTIEGTLGDLVGKIMCELVGCLEVPGGQTGCSTPRQSWLEPGEDGVRKPISEAAGEAWVWPPERVDSKAFYPVSHTLVHVWAKGIVDPEAYHLEYNTEVLMTSGGGPIRSSFDREIFEKAYSLIPFHYSFSLTFDESAIMADIVLPDQAFLEKDTYHPGSSSPPGHKVMVDATRGGIAFYWRDASKIKPAYNARNADQILLDLADRLGIMTGEKGLVSLINSSYSLEGENVLDINQTVTLRQIAEAYLKQTFGPENSLESLIDGPPVYKYATRGAKNYNYFYWPDNTTRYPMYFIHLTRVGNLLRNNIKEAGLTSAPGWEGLEEDFFKGYVSIPVWTPCPEFNPPPEYDMWAINWKTPMAPFYCGDTYGNVWLHEAMSTYDPYEYSVHINTETAKKKGIQDGDTIVIESRYGQTSGRAKVTELIHPDVVGIPAGHGARSILANPIVGEGAYFNALCSIDEQDQAVDPLTGGLEEGPAVKIYKA